MRELSIFVDESGDFGEYSPHSPYYIVSMVFHDQDSDISKHLNLLEMELSNIGYPNHCVHSGPIIRREQEYTFEDILVRKKIISRLMGFIRKTKVNYKSFYIEKRHLSDITDATGRISKIIGMWLKNNYDMLLSFDVVKVYYDNGQIELSKILSSVFNVLLPSVEMKKVIPSQYRLFQVADLICTLKLLELKAETGNLSASEKKFFSGEIGLEKNYLKDFRRQELK